METSLELGKVATMHKMCKYENTVDRCTIMHNDNGTINLIALKRGQALSTHKAPADAMVYVVEGRLNFTVNDVEQPMQAGDFLLMDKDTLHSLVAVEDTKFILTLIK